MPLRRSAMKKTTSNLFVAPYILWILLFVLAPVAMIVWQSFFNIEGHPWKLQDLLRFAKSDLSQNEFELCFICGDYHSCHFSNQLPNCIFIDATKAQTALVDAHHLADLGQSASQSLCFYWDFRTKWICQSIFKFYWDRCSTNPVYRFLFYFCSQLYWAALYDIADF